MTYVGCLLCSLRVNPGDWDSFVTFAQGFSQKPENVVQAIWRIDIVNPRLDFFSHSEGLYYFSLIYVIVSLARIKFYITSTGPSFALRIKQIIKYYEYSPGTLTRAFALLKVLKKKVN